MDAAYRLTEDVPSIDDYRRLRLVAGLTPRSAAAAAAGLPNTVVGIVVRCADDAVGMGRAIGDGLCYQLVDIAVMPEHQGRGIGKAIVTALLDRLRAIAPAEAYVSLIADGEAHRLYAQYGFAPTAPQSIGMERWLGPAGDDPA